MNKTKAIIIIGSLMTHLAIFFLFNPTLARASTGECDANCRTVDNYDCRGGACGDCQRRVKIKQCDGNNDGIFTNCQDFCDYDVSCCKSPPPQPTVVTSTPTPMPKPTSASPTIPPECNKKVLGDANCDNKINGIDYSIWLNHQCHPSETQVCSDYRADFNQDGKVDDLDLNIWSKNSD